MKYFLRASWLELRVETLNEHCLIDHKQAITCSRAANSKRMVNQRPLLFYHHRKGKEYNKQPVLGFMGKNG